jgi:hypothetical protein
MKRLASVVGPPAPREPEVVVVGQRGTPRLPSARDLLDLIVIDISQV